MIAFFTSLWELTLDMAPYLLLGFAIAGLLHAFVPAQAYHKYLARPGFRSVCNATLLGIPLPLCSCGVLPTTVSLRRSGASRGACTSFLIATPQTGVDSILATYSLLGLPYALLRPVAALVTGVLGGVITDRVFRKEEETEFQKEEQKVFQKESQKEKQKELNAAGKECSADDSIVRRSFLDRLKQAFAYGFGELLQDVGRWLVIGLLIAAAITVAVPEDFFAGLQHWPLLNMLLVLVIAVPMYVCATGSIPIALSLMLKGMTPGAAFVLLMAGPAINAASVLVLDKAFGRKQTIVYLLSIVGGAIGFGLIIDYLLPAAWFIPQGVDSLHAAGICTDMCETTAWWKIVCGILFAGLLVLAVWRRYFGHKSCCCGESEGKCCDESEVKRCDGAEGKCSCSSHTPAPVATLSLKVSGMRCSHCAANVRGALSALAFVDSVDVNLAEGVVMVIGKAGEPMDELIIRKEIENAGYTVEN